MNFLIETDKNASSKSASRYVILCCLSMMYFTFYSFAQSPDAFNYQAVIRDAGGAVISNQSVSLQLTIKQGSASGSAVYTESFNTNTNDNGLISIQVGNGNVISGDFTTIAWGNGPYFLETALDPSGGTSYSLMGTSQLLSVPYALYAKSSGSSLWEEEPEGIHYGGGNLNIGTTSDLFAQESVRVQIRDDREDAINLRLVGDNPDGVTEIMFTSNGPDFNNFVVGLNNSNSPSGANEGFIWQFTDNDIKFGTNSIERLRIKNSGNVIVKTDDIYIETVGKGVIMKSPNGDCWRMTVDNTGNPVFTTITCPN